jgi:hypothetical protein
MFCRNQKWSYCQWGYVGVIDTRIKLCDWGLGTWLSAIELDAVTD